MNKRTDEKMDSLPFEERKRNRRRGRYGRQGCLRRNFGWGAFYGLLGKFPTLRWGLALALALGAVCFSGCERAATPAPRPATRPAEVRVVQPSRGEIARTIILPGEIKAYQQATLYAKVTGYLKTITVDKGDHVKAGQILAELEVPELVADRARYRAEVQVAQRDHERLSESVKKASDLVAPQTVDDALGRYAIAQANLERIETLLGYARITAPFAGVVTRRMVDPGAFIAAATAGNGSQNAALLTLADFSTVRVQIAVPEAEATRIAAGQTVGFTIQGLPERRYSGTITRFAYALDETTRTMLAEIEVPNASSELRPGMYAEVTIAIERKQNAVIVPSEAVLSERSGSSVFLPVENRARKTPVTLGFREPDRIEILTGLSAAQPVILSGKRALTNEEPIIVLEGK